MRTRLAITYDVPGWAFHQFAAGLAGFAPDDVSVSLLCEHAGEVADADVQFHFSWISAPLGVSPRHATLVTSAGVLYERFDPLDWNTNIVTDLRNALGAREKLPKFDAVLTANRALFEACRVINPRTYLTPIGVNDSLFKPGSGPRTGDGRLRVGWCGNPGGARSVKGYQEVLLPLMNRLGDRHYCWQINDRNWANAFSWNEMAAWYNSLDIFLCTSINEGSPNTIFEAAACGVTVISTDVGMCDDWTELRQAGLVVPAYKDEAGCRNTSERITGLLERFREDRRDLEALGGMLRESIERRYAWRKLAPRWYAAILGRDLPS
jgi:hypothetical protein